MAGLQAVSTRVRYRARQILFIPLPQPQPLVLPLPPPPPPPASGRRARKNPTDRERGHSRSRAAHSSSTHACADSRSLLNSAALFAHGSAHDRKDATRKRTLPKRTHRVRGERDFFCLTDKERNRKRTKKEKETQHGFFRRRRRRRQIFAAAAAATTTTTRTGKCRARRLPSKAGRCLWSTFRCTTWKTPSCEA